MAQLGARVNGIHEVAGSIPASSTTPSLLSRPLIRRSRLHLGGRINTSGVSESSKPLAVLSWSLLNSPLLL